MGHGDDVGWREVSGEVSSDLVVAGGQQSEEVTKRTYGKTSKTTSTTEICTIRKLAVLFDTK